MSIVYEVTQGFDFTAEEKDRFQAELYLPGDLVVPEPPEGLRECREIGVRRAPLRAALRRACGHALRVTATYVRRAAGGLLVQVEHTFAGVDGRWDASLISDARRPTLIHGAIVAEGSTGWLVPIEGNAAQLTEDTAGEPILLSSEVERHVRWICQVKNAADLAHSLGEFGVVREWDGRGRLVSAAWTSRLAVAEASVARAFIGRMVAVSTVPA